MNYFDLHVSAFSVATPREEFPGQNRNYNDIIFCFDRIGTRLGFATIFPLSAARSGWDMWAYVTAKFPTNSIWPVRLVWMR